MKAIETIYLAWRNGRGGRRILVGEIAQNKAGEVSFRYLEEGVLTAIQQGFTYYTDFPDVQRTYSTGVLDIFGRRLMKKERADVQRYYDFWEIPKEYQNDTYFLLAHTQGLLATDNFEFLADYNLVENIQFISEISGLSISKIEGGFLDIDDSLTWESETDNPQDPSAVKVFKNGRELGYIKKVHCKIFHKKGGKYLKIKVKSIDRNGILNRVFVNISL